MATWNLQPTEMHADTLRSCIERLHGEANRVAQKGGEEGPVGALWLDRAAAVVRELLTAHEAATTSGRSEARNPDRFFLVIAKEPGDSGGKLFVAFPSLAQAESWRQRRTSPRSDWAIVEVTSWRFAEATPTSTSWDPKHCPTCAEFAARFAPPPARVDGTDDER